MVETKQKHKMLYVVLQYSEYCKIDEISIIAVFF
jgi:hypothetical protein